jgi:hypothetical protein
MKRKDNNKEQYFIYYTEDDLAYLENSSKEELIKELRDVYINTLNDWMRQTEGLLKDMDKLVDLKHYYELALFMTIRNNVVLPKGFELGKSEKEINKMAVETMDEVMKMIDFEVANKKYKEAIYGEKLS